MTEGLNSTIKILYAVFPTPLLRNFRFFGLSPIFCIAKHRGGGGNTSLVFIRFPYAVNGRPLYRFAIPCNAAGYGGGRVKGGFLVFS